MLAGQPGNDPGDEREQAAREPTHPSGEGTSQEQGEAVRLPDHPPLHHHQCVLVSLADENAF